MTRQAGRQAGRQAAAMTSQPDPIDGFLAMIGERQTALTELAVAVEKCRGLDLFGASSGFSAIAAPVPVLALPAMEDAPVKMRRPKAPVPAARSPRNTARPRVATSVHIDRILAFLGKQRAGIKLCDLIAGVGVSDFTLRPVIADLVTQGQVVRTGATISLRYGLPHVMSGVETARPQPPATLKPKAAPSYASLLDDRLATGASYALEELIRWVQRGDASVTGEAVKVYLEEQVKAGRAARIPSGDTVRYQRRIAQRAKTA